MFSLRTFIPSVSCIKKSDELYELTVTDRTTQKSWYTRIQTYYWTSEYVNIDKLETVFKIGLKKGCVGEYNFDTLFEFDPVENKLQMTFIIEFLSLVLKSKRDEKIFILDPVKDDVLVEHRKLVESVAKEIGCPIIEPEECVCEIKIDFHDPGHRSTDYTTITILMDNASINSLYFIDQLLRTEYFSSSHKEFLLNNSVLTEEILKNHIDRVPSKMYEFYNIVFNKKINMLNCSLKYILNNYSISHIKFTEHGFIFSYLEKTRSIRNITVIENCLSLPKDCRYKILDTHFTKGFVMIEFI